MLQAAKYLMNVYFYFLILLLFCLNVIAPIAPKLLPIFQLQKSG